MSSSQKPPPVPRKAQVNVPAIDGDPAIGDDTEISSSEVGDDTELTARPSLAGLRHRGSDTAIDRVIDDETIDESSED